MKKSTVNGIRRGWIGRDAGIVVVSAALALSGSRLSANEFFHHFEGTDDYQQINLVSDLPGVAQLQDTNLVNAWGISYGPATPFWVSDNGTGLSTLYSVTNDAQGMAHVSKVSLEVSIPGDGTPSGQVFNFTSGYNSNAFLFVSEDGTISGWRGALGTSAEVLLQNSNAVYKGVTLITNASGPLLLVANFAAGTVEAYDGDMNLVGQFADTNAPVGYAPFNVQSIRGMVFVTYAKQDAAKHDDVAGPGNGLIDVLDPATGHFHRFATGADAGGRLKAINSPWGVALAPDTFGEHGGELLVGNFGSGTIMAFDAAGRFEGFLEDRHERAIVIDGLWALVFGNGGKGGVPENLYFTAGPNGESDGLFGSIEPIFKQHRR